MLLTNVAWSGAITGWVGFVYDNDFRVESLSVNGVEIAGYEYDNDGMLSAAGDLALNRDPQSGFLTNTVLGNVADFLSYSGFGETSAYLANSGGTNLYGVVYGRDKVGRITNCYEPR